LETNPLSAKTQELLAIAIFGFTYLLISDRRLKKLFNNPLSKRHLSNIVKLCHALRIPPAPVARLLAPCGNGDQQARHPQRRATCGTQAAHAGDGPVHEA
jgi:hypothetical protein